jgi:predicted nucleic acid-binding Zn ribbon protein
MERAARLIKKNNVSRDIFSDEDLIRATWPQAVGKAIASHTLALKLVRGTVIVEVEDAIWQKQLYALSAQILERVRKASGNSTIERLEFRVGARRRQPQRAELPRAKKQMPAPFDEAESIKDPVLQRVFRSSRKKASA